MSMKFKSLALCLLLAASCVAPAQAAAPQSNKDIVVAFFRMMFQDRDIDEAVRLYVGKNYIQHNPYMRDGVEPMVDFFPITSSSIRRPASTSSVSLPRATW